MNAKERILLLVVFVVTCALPAFANNLPQPDAVFSVLLIFPIVLISMRLANTTPALKSSKRFWLTGFLVLCFVVSMGGTVLGIIFLVPILVYGIARGIQIISRSPNQKWRALGAVVIAWVIFEVGDYYASLVSPVPGIALSEAQAIYRLRALSTAETNYAGVGSKPEAVYGTTADLAKSSLIDSAFATDAVRKGYRYGEIVESSKRQYVFYAIPVQAQASIHWSELLPGASLLAMVRGRPEVEYRGVRSFAVDETGVIRYDIHAVAEPISREQIMKWEKL